MNSILEVLIYVLMTIKGVWMSSFPYSHLHHGHPKLININSTLNVLTFTNFRNPATPGVWEDLQSNTKISGYSAAFLNVFVINKS